MSLVHTSLSWLRRQTFAEGYDPLINPIPRPEGNLNIPLKELLDNCEQLDANITSLAADLSALETDLQQQIDDLQTYVDGQLSNLSSQVSNDFYTKTQLNTSGAGGQVHWNNVTNQPSLYTQNQLNTSGAGGQVHWDNVTNKILPSPISLANTFTMILTNTTISSTSYNGITGDFPPGALGENWLLVVFWRSFSDGGGTDDQYDPFYQTLVNVEFGPISSEAIRLSYGGPYQTLITGFRI